VLVWAQLKESCGSAACLTQSPRGIFGESEPKRM